MYRPIRAPRGIAVPAAAVFFSAFLATPFASAQESRIEEVVVTATRQEQSLQEVPVAVTAFTGTMMEDRQIINPSDLQLNTPNVTFTATNFGGNNFSIRGIGRLVTAASGEAGVSTNINEIPIGTNLTAVEFYDVERVEVLRGPQGTLFGKNATGGAVNMVTKRPDMDVLGGFIDGEYGDYNHRRIKGAFNLPLNDKFAIRIAGLQLERDGYIDNTAAGQIGLDGTTIPGIDNEIDGRDLYSYRVTAEWDITERMDLWLMYSKFREKDDRARITNQVCQRNDLPTIGCTADGFGYDTPHFGSTTGGIFSGLSTLAPLQGATPLGTPGGNSDTNLTYNWPAPASNDLRKMHTDFDPTFKNIENLFAGGLTYDFDKFQVGIQGAYQETKYVARQDYNMDVGPQLAPTPALNPTGYYPVSDANGDYSSGYEPNARCSYNDGTAGFYGGCIANDSPSDRVFAFDHSSASAEYWTIEAKVASDFDGRWNFTAGANTYKTESKGGDYYVFANTLDLVGLQGAPLLGLPRAYPTMFNVPGEPDQGKVAEGYAAFGEVYFDLTESIKITAGLRYNKDKKYTSSTSVLYNAIALQDIIGPVPGLDDPYWTRQTGFLLGAPYDSTLTDFYDATAAFEAASTTAALSPERFAAAELIPITPGFNETRFTTGSPDKEDWSEVTGRLGADWQINDNSMAYFTFSRGYKPGGFNPPINPTFQDTSSFTFASEKVDAFEIGSKNVFLDNTLVLNGSIFYYKYKDLQVARIRNNSSLNENIDTDNWGLEIETVWTPDRLPNLQIDAAYSYLNTDVQNATSLDPLDRTAGNSDYTTLKNIDLGSATGVNYIALTSDVLPIVPAALADLGALSAQNGTAVPGTDYPNGIPAYFSRTYLDTACGGCTLEGLNTDIDGNSLPNSPENTIHIGAQYTFNIQQIFGSITARLDYYWQDDMYGREFNTAGDKIDSWDQFNASLIYESNNGNWKATVWARNLEDEDNVTGHYLTSDTSGLYRNYFLTEPRVYGASLRYLFGGG